MKQNFESTRFLYVLSTKRLVRLQRSLVGLMSIVAHEPHVIILEKLKKKKLNVACCIFD